MKKGRFIVCDGSNGAGKTTIIRSIADYLQSMDRDSVTTREPGGTVIGEKIREILLSHDATEMADVTELMLFAAARAQHVREKIVPALETGKVVVSDRYDSATLSFQHYARGLSFDLVSQLNDIAIAGCKPDLTIILDLDPVTGLQRVGARGGSLDRLEKERLEFLSKARDGYLRQAKDDPKRFVVIDASQSPEEVLTEVIHLVAKIIE